MEKINCIIIHGCPSDEEKAMDPETRTYDKHWMPWIKEKLEAAGIKTEVPLMPEPWAPDYEKFKQEFEKYPVTENTILVGHSCGCSFLVRWLGESKVRIKKLILVAPWKIGEDASPASKAFYDFTFDGTLKDRVGHIVMFTSDTERENGKRGLEMFHGAIGGEIVNLKGHGHYILGDMGTAEFPELLVAVKNPAIPAKSDDVNGFFEYSEGTDCAFDPKK